jgi:KDO2-lipid IV(A) lauroyltransferase
MLEYLLYWIVKTFGVVVRALPVNAALALGRGMGLIGYYCDIRHRSQAYANLKVAFSKTKKPREIRKITKKLFQSYGQNLIELFRLPLLTPENFRDFVNVEGKEHVTGALKQNKGLILLVMHFGSWELASFSFAMLGSPYRVIVRPQKKFQKLDGLLNSYRSCRGSMVVSRGVGTRDVIRGLKNNEIVAVGVDQGGRDGALVPFFGRTASMAVGAIRLALKMETPICFSIIIREKGARHRLIIQEPLKLENTGDLERDIETNLKRIVPTMEHYIEQHPAEYMWFYKIWKYSRESTVMILNDGRTGHLRQAQTVAGMIRRALAERGIQTLIEVKDVVFRNKLTARLMSVIGLLTNPQFHQGRLGFLKLFLTKQSFRQIMSMKADFIISCGSSLASVNYLLSPDHRAKSIVIQKPGMLSFRKFDLVIIPEHDGYAAREGKPHVVVTKGAANLVEENYLKEQSGLFIQTFPHLAYSRKCRIGLLIGGDMAGTPPDEKRLKMISNQIKEAAAQVDAEILATTSRRTSPIVDLIMARDFQTHPRCKALVVASRENIPGTVGGILDLCGVIVVSGDSVSMISEAASSGKKVIVFTLSPRYGKKNAGKHDRFLENLSRERYVLVTDGSNISELIQSAAKNKIQTKRLDDNEAIFQAARKVI